MSDTTKTEAPAAVVTNPFDSDSIARRYADGRFYYHHEAFELATEILDLSGIRIALDLGCGTGLSSRAAREKAETVIAVDVSMPMLHNAEEVPGVHFSAARAEALPIRSATIDLATVGTAFHWFDPTLTLRELARVLRPGAPLIVYGDFLDGVVNDRAEFREWLEESFLPDVPNPPRHARFDPDRAAGAGFAEAHYTERLINMKITSHQLADYLISQSNSEIAITSGTTTADELRHRILTDIERFFPGGSTHEVAFGIRVWTSIKMPLD